MREMGAPITYEATRHGYVYEDDAFELPAMNITEGELLAVLVADRALSSYRNTPFYDRLRGVFDRLTTLLPDRVTIQTQDLARNMSVIAEPVTDIDEGVWAVLRDCLESQRTARVHYRAPKYSTSVPRPIDPYHIVGYRGEWYLIGYSHHDEEVRIYALSRIAACDAERGRFDRPANFDPAAYIDPAFGVYLGGEEEHIAVRFDAAVASRIAERQWHPNQTIEYLDDGGIILRYATNQLDQTRYWVASWGPAAEILQPAQLRERAAQWLERAAHRYRTGTRGSAT